MSESVTGGLAREEVIPERIVQQGTIPVLKSLLRMSPSVPLRPVVQILTALKDDHNDPSGIDALLAEQDPKVATNAIAGYAIGKIWAEIGAWTGQYARGTPENDSSKNEFPFPEEGAIQAAFEESSEKGLLLLQQSVQNVSSQLISSSLEKEMRDQYDASLQRRYGKLAEVFTSKDLGARLERGFLTANRAVWGFLNSITPLYVQQYNKPISQEEFETIGKSAKELTVLLANLDMSAFGFALSRLNESRDTGKPSVFKSISLEEKDGALRIEMTEDALRHIAQEAPKYQLETRTGCPAIAVRTESGNNAVADYFDWNFNLLREYYFPHLAEHCAMLQESSNK